MDSDKSGSVKVKERYVMLPENHNFAINPEYGWITLMNKLDYEVCLSTEIFLIQFSSKIVSLFLDKYSTHVACHCNR